MYYNSRKLIISILWVLIGITLIILSKTGIIGDALYTGFGGGLIAVGILQIVRNIKYRTNEGYRHAVDIAANDERNRYIRMKALSITAYIAILAAAVVSIVMYVSGKSEYGQLFGYCVCFMVLIYLIVTLILRKTE